MDLATHVCMSIACCCSKTLYIAYTAQYVTICFLLYIRFCDMPLKAQPTTQTFRFPVGPHPKWWVSTCRKWMPRAHMGSEVGVSRSFLLVSLFSVPFLSSISTSISSSVSLVLSFLSLFFLCLSSVASHWTSISSSVCNRAVNTFVKTLAKLASCS
jgi:hypothetical protein